MVLYIVILSTQLALCFGVKFQILNRQISDIWVGIQGNAGHAHLNRGGFALQPGENVSINAPSNWTGRFWARTGCNPLNNHCDTGDCGNKLQCNGARGVPPASLVEIALKGFEGLDFYDVSLVDGFNTMVAIEPLGGRSDGGRYSCKKAACQAPLNDFCPEKLKVRNGNKVIACNSACNAFNTDQYCCRGAFGTPDKCKSCTWPENYPAFFKIFCPYAYSYAYDDQKSTFTCRAEAYLVTFGN